MSSGSSESASQKAVMVDIDWNKVLRLAKKIVALLDRKRGGRFSREELMVEYWAVRFVALLCEAGMDCPVFDNEAEIVAFLRNIIDGLWKQKDVAVT